MDDLEMTNVIITLEPRHIAFATKVGRKRRRNAEEHNRKAHNGAPTDSRKALSMDIHGALCECAAFLYLRPIKWHTFKPFGIKNLPDLGTFIDVKGRSEDWHDLIVQMDDPVDWAYVLVRSHNHPDYDIVGWMWGEEAKRWPIIDPARGRPAHFVKDGFLDPKELYEIVRSRTDTEEENCFV